MSAKSNIMSIEDYVNLYEKGQLRKPRIQRKKRWSQTQMKEFIDFLIQIRISIMPFVMNEVIMDGVKILNVFDGNNRSNAILEFHLAPLNFKTEAIPVCFSTISDILKTVPLKTWLQPRYNRSKFLKEYPEALAHMPSAEDVEVIFDGMLQTIAEWKFYDIKLQTAIFENLSDNQMQTIYESINKSGVRLTRQEILASSTCNNRYSSADFTNYLMLQTRINEYYADMNSNEKLSIEIKSESLNTFEILVALQLDLSSRFEFIPEPMNEKKDLLDIMFRMWEIIEGDFSKRSSNINVFISAMERGCQTLDDALNTLYDPQLSLSSITKYKKGIKKNHVLQMLTYYYIRMKAGELQSKIKETIVRILLTHALICELPTEEHCKAGPDILEFNHGGGVIPEKIKHIMTTGTFESVPTNAQIENLLNLALKHSIITSEIKPKTRRPLTRFKAIAFSAFFNYFIPAGLKGEKHASDHIVPFSAICDESYDSCRLGNLQLIPEKLNKKRGKKPITDAWIEENGLRYQHYPNEREYALLCNSEKINVNKYNIMCDKREVIYLSAIMKMFTLGVGIS